MTLMAKMRDTRARRSEPEHKLLEYIPADPETVLDSSDTCADHLRAVKNSVDGTRSW
ncbi:MAG: hypothetical protein ACK5HY_05005 [Parahaliea sp.]